MSSLPIEYLRHMLVEADYLVKFSTDLERDQFIQDDTLQRAFVRSLEIIGEATKHVPEDFRLKHPSFQWRMMAGLRDRLIHAYFGVDYELVWDIVVNKIPELRSRLGELLSKIDNA